MILQALCELSDREQLLGDDPYYELKRVPWIIRIGKNGEYLGMLDNRIPVVIQPKSPKGTPKTEYHPRWKWVPNEPERTSGDYAFFLCDTTEYVFGMQAPASKGAKRPEAKLQNRRQLFRAKINECFEQIRDEAIGALLKMLDKAHAYPESIQLVEECGPSDLITFLYAPDMDLLIGDRPHIRAYWAQKCQNEITQQPLVECLVTGSLSPRAVKHPMLKKVPGGTTSGVALVSYNASAFESYGLKGNENAPVSQMASKKFSVALNRLLNREAPDPKNPDAKLPQRNYRISSDTVVCFWAIKDEAQEMCDQFIPILEANPNEVSGLYQSIWKGKAPPDLDTSAFYAMTITGTQGRAIVRDWLKSTVRDVAAHLAEYFLDLDIVRNTPPPKVRPLPPQLPLTSLMRSLAPQGKSDEIPPHICAQWIHASLTGQRYPMTVFHRALERMRAEIGQDDWFAWEKRDARAALIKAILIRNYHKEVQPNMDAENRQIGYLLGRLLALIERAQQTALGDVNATVIDRFFSGASATPGAVYPRLLKNMRHHIKKASDSEKSRGTAIWLDKQSDEIMKEITGFPAFLSLEQQGLFVLGYHHQRHHLWKKREKSE